MTHRRGSFRAGAQLGVPDVRSVVSFALILVLFPGLALGASAADHAHVSVGESIECVACHGVRVAPPESRADAHPAPATVVPVPRSRVPEVPSVRITVPSADLPRGPPAA